MKNRSYNKRAILKFIAVIGYILYVWHFNFPILHWWVEWFQDIYRFSYDIQFSNSYSLTKKVFYAVYPLFFITLLLLWYAFIYKQHRKNYYYCGFPQGTVCWIFNKPGKGRGHVYDFYSVLHGFKEIDWENIPRPFTGKFFDGKTIIYWKSSIWQPFTHWNKDYLPKPETQFQETLTTVYATSNKRINIRHDFNPKCDVNILSDDDVYDKKMKSLYMAMEREKNLNYQITEDVQRLARANPDVANDMAHRDIPIPKSTRDKLIIAKEKRADVSTKPEPFD